MTDPPIALTCAPADSVPEPAALCTAMRAALARAAPDRRVHDATNAPLPDALHLRFAARMGAPNQILGRLVWRQGGGPETRGPEIGFDVTDAPLSPARYPAFARAVLRATGFPPRD